MSELDFHIEFKIDGQEISEKFLDEVGKRLERLADEHADMIGAAVGVEEIAGVEDAFLYEAHIVAYIRPENIAAVEKRETPEDALMDALENLEKQIREERSKRRTTWEQPEKLNRISLFDLTPKEIHDSYVGSTIPKDLVLKSRDTIAARLMLEEKLDERSAFYAADQIQAYAYQSTPEK